MSATVGYPPLLPTSAESHPWPQLSLLDTPPNGRLALTATLETRNRVRKNHESVGVTSDHPCVLSRIAVTAWVHETRQDGTHVVLYTISQL
jgi:hypothetical protein